MHLVAHAESRLNSNSNQANKKHSSEFRTSKILLSPLNFRLGYWLLQKKMTKGSMSPLKFRKNYGKFREKNIGKLKKYLYCIYLEIESSNILLLWRSPFYLFSTVNICTFLPSLNLSLSSLPVCGFFLWFGCYFFVSLPRTDCQYVFGGSRFPMLAC